MEMSSGINARTSLVHARKGISSVGSGIWGEGLRDVGKYYSRTVRSRSRSISQSAGSVKASTSRRSITTTTKNINLTSDLNNDTTMVFQPVPLFGKQKAINPKSVASIILGGGPGTQLFPLTNSRATPAFNSASLNRHIARTYNLCNGLNFGSDGFVEVLAATQTPGEAGMNWFQGTADAVRQFIWVFEDNKNKNIEHILILSGDHLYRMDYMEFVQKHIDTGADITVSCVPVDGRWRYPKSNDFGSEILPSAVEEHNVQAYLFNDYWEDIGTIKSFYDANLALTHEVPKFQFYDPKTPFFTSPRFLPPTKVEKCRIVDAIISHGCFLRECSVQNSIVGVRSRLDYGVEMEDTMMMGADYYETEAEIASLLADGDVPIGVGHNTKIRNCIIDMNARIGANVVIANKDGVQEADRPGEGFYIRSGITVVLKNSTVKDGTII